jgi:hypothetical protein
VPDALARVRAFAERVAPLADRNSDAHRRAVQALSASTGLSPEGVAYALENCLETGARNHELSELCASVAPSAVAHVLLSSGVFTAAYRAVCLGLAASSNVMVRPSRREPVFAGLLHELSGGAFTLVAELFPKSGEQLFAYGSDETMSALRAALQSGVILHAHSHGIGVAVVPTLETEERQQAARALAFDAATFDQRGCLSPRSVLIAGDPRAARLFAEELQQALEQLASTLPLGTLTQTEREDIELFSTSMLYAGPVLGEEGSLVALDEAGERIVVSPVGRVLHVTHASDAPRVLTALEPMIACLGLFGDGAQLPRDCLPNARHCRLGQMQQPRLDGPVDRRTRPEEL